MLRHSSFLFVFTAAILTTSALGQPQVAPPKQQTARQALIEIVTKGGDALLKHLTVEVQDALKANKKFKSTELSMLNSMTPESGLQSFEAGEVLFVYNDAAQHTKYEVHIDNDDLAGDEDSLLLSLHVFRDEKEQDTEWGLMSSHFTVSMKLQQNVWRLNTISVGAEFPVGDAKFIEKMFLKSTTSEVSGVGLVAPAAAGVYVSSGTGDVAPPGLVPENVVTMLAYAESMFAKQHPDVGFTCSFSELSESSKMMGIDQQVNNGTYNGYRFALAGCEGKPAGSYQITAEPLAGKGGKAFCSDATQNLRSSDDGRGATCLASGKAQSLEADDGGALVGVHFVSAESKPKQ